MPESEPGLASEPKPRFTHSTTEMAQRGPRRTVRPRTLDQFIENARGGDPAHLWDLYWFTEDPQFRTIGVLRLALSHLSIENVPAHGGGGIAGGQIVGDRAVASIFLLLSGVFLFKTDPSFLEAAARPIIESIDSICVWAQLCIHFSLAAPGAGPEETYNRIGRLFVQLLLHPVFQDALLLAPAFHNLVIQMWVTSSITMDLDTDEQYHVLLLLAQFVDDPEDDIMQLFTQRIMSRPLRWASEFAAITVERMHRLRNLIVGGQGAIERVIDYTWMILKVFESLVSACEHLRRAFIKVDYLKQIALDLNTMSAALVERKATQFLALMFPATWQIAVHIFNTKTPFRSVKNARDIISGNFLAHTMRLLASSHLTPDKKGQGAEIMKLLGRYASYPDVIVELAKLPEIDPFSLRGLTENREVSLYKSRSRSIERWHRKAKEMLSLFLRYLLLHRMPEKGLDRVPSRGMYGIQERAHP
ncbi:hypothetical protein D9611_008912 [Ephemerocybe angulata]|uniref:Uncharacterized protein n=1 Tax=Ephemerocybe angulata TaxID=980116 RepID=A0A8H5FCM0_9AGAR|nr:hypothetical protein D9611_008912 [Tulosesus angulatus]